jgi:hypothetical protein
VYCIQQAVIIKFPAKQIFAKGVCDLLNAETNMKKGLKKIRGKEWIMTRVITNIPTP